MENCSISIGTCLKSDEFYQKIDDISRSEFEHIQLYFTAGLGKFDIEDTKKILEKTTSTNTKLHSIGLYLNPIQSEQAREEIKKCLRIAPKLGISVLSTFAGALENGTVEESLPYFKKYFLEFLTIAKDSNVRIAIENYANYGFWYRTTTNIGFCPRSWEMMFNEIDDPFLGLEWEPSHQIDQFIDPIAQLKVWKDKVIHIHGKDCHMDKKILEKVGILSCLGYSNHRFPGLGDTDWKQVFRIMNEAKYCGGITIEGYHDPEYKDDREMEGQINALLYLKKCRSE